VGLLGLSGLAATTNAAIAAQALFALFWTWVMSGEWADLAVVIGSVYVQPECCLP
jgi:hypothetical protein